MNSPAGVVCEPRPPGKEQAGNDAAAGRSAGFALRKYYLDAVTEDGAYFIGYAAELSYKRLSFAYLDTVHAPELHGLFRGPKLSRGRQPVVQNGRLIWRHPGLGFDGTWSQLAAARRFTLLSTSQGHVDWHCLQPASRVSLHTSSGMVVSALGYCEHLTLAIPPWQLGLAELTWGRFVSPSQSLVWIVWRGKYPRRLVIWNGSQVDRVGVSEGHVTADEFTLVIEPARTIRNGKLGRNVIEKVPPARHLVPGALLQVHEHKQLGRGILRMPDGRAYEGWVVHEKVTWPN